MPRTEDLGAIVGDLVLSLFDARRRELGLATGRPRFGFKTVGKRGCKRVVPDPETRAWAKKFLQLREHGFTDYRGRKVSRPSWEKIALYLIHQNVQLPNSTTIAKSTLQRWAAAELNLQRQEARQQGDTTR